MFRKRKLQQEDALISPKESKKIKCVIMWMWISFPLLLIFSNGLYWVFILSGVTEHKEENHKLYLQVNSTFLGLMLTATASIFQMRGNKAHEKLISSALWASLEMAIHLANLCLLCTIFLSYMAVKSVRPTGDIHASFEAMFIYVGFVYISYVVIIIKKAFKHI